MKRGKPLRADPEKVREWQQRTRKALRRTRTQRTPTWSLETLNHPQPKSQVEGEGLPGRCVVCAGPAQDLHHVMPKGKWPHLANEAANLVAVCRRDHDLHERAMARIPRQALPTETLRLAKREGLMWYIERTYPTEDGWR